MSCLKTRSKEWWEIVIHLLSGKKISLEAPFYLVVQNRFTWPPSSAREPMVMTRMAHNFNIYHGGRQILHYIRREREGKGKERNCCWNRPAVFPEGCWKLGLKWEKMSLAMEKICFLSWSSPSAWGSVCMCGSVFRTDCHFPRSLILLLWLRASSGLRPWEFPLRSGLSFIDSPSFHHCCRFISVFA